MPGSETCSRDLRITSRRFSSWPKVFLGIREPLTVLQPAHLPMCVSASACYFTWWLSRDGSLLDIFPHFFPGGCKTKGWRKLDGNSWLTWSFRSYQGTVVGQKGPKVRGYVFTNHLGGYSSLSFRARWACQFGGGGTNQLQSLVRSFGLNQS